MSFLRVFRQVILRHFRFEWGKLLLSILGVAIGVAMFTAIRLANTTAYKAFEASLNAVSGRANLQAISVDGLGFDERLIAKLRKSRAVEAAAPVIEQYAQVEDSARVAVGVTGTPILVLGIDVFSEAKFRSYEFDSSETTSAFDSTGGLEFLLSPSAIIITDKLADRYDLVVGDSIRLTASGKRLSFAVVGIVEAEGTASALAGNFALLDVATAQEVFGRIGKLDRIDLLVPDDRRAEIKEYLSESLPSGVIVQEPEARGTQTTQMLDAFDLNLSALAFIALFTAMFIIYNTTLTNALRRRRELGIMRAVGGGRGLIIGLFLTEAGLIGLLGAAVGLPLGIGLAEFAVDQVTRTVSVMYVMTVAEHLFIDVPTLVIGALLGIFASLLSALPAAIEGSRAHPRETFSTQNLEARFTLNYRKIFAAAAISFALAWGCSELSPIVENPVLGFVSAGFVLVGFAFLTPPLVILANRIFGKAIKRAFGVEGELANAYLLQSLTRTSTAIAALTTAIAMLVGVSTMIGSFRQTIDYWLRQTIQADVYITIANNRVSASSNYAIPAPVVEGLGQIPGVKRLDAVNRTRLTYDGRTITVGGARFNTTQEEASLAFKEGEWNEVMAALDESAVIVSEGFGMRFGKEIGDTVTLSTPSGAQSMRIAGIYYDYATDAGTILMRKPAFDRIFRDSSVSNVALYLEGGTSVEEVRERIERDFAADYNLIVYSNRTLRDEALDIFDQTFAVTYALQLIAIIVAAIGIANTLSALTIERSREIGILKAVGATPAQIRKMTLVQAGLIGFASQGLGAIAGLILSAILIYVVNRVSFGWTIRFQASPEIILLSAGLVIVTAIVAGIGPANAAARKRVAELVRAE